MTKYKVSMTIEKEVYEQFKKYCENNGMKVSTKVESLMRNLIKDTSLNEYINK